MTGIPLNERIIFALDLASPEEARQWILRLEGSIRFYKVGLQLFLADWFDTVDWITARGHKVMLDLKLFDVPATVRLAIQQLTGRRITYATVHAPAAKAAVEAGSDAGILAVTVLTSLGQDELDEMGFQGSIEDLVSIRAAKALRHGCKGIVCSGLEAARLRRDLGEDFLIVTPGIRTEQEAAQRPDDQKRVLTAGSAIRNGADHVVVGRPIRSADDPLETVKVLQEEIRQSLQT